MQKDPILESVARIHSRLWRQSSDVSAQTKSAQRVTKEWQQDVGAKPKIDRSRKGVESEAPIGNGRGEKIDVVDWKTRTAYELKVSANNTHFEFYRDVFKVLAFNLNNEDYALRRFIFVTPESGAERLRKGFGDDVRELATKHDLEVEIYGIREDK